ncbi:formate dehydrogenase subunit alpha [Picrophilus oshimae]|uniref:Formate dehydrogenase major subunit n=1 Tax=Picrophilus torridus (strain ATCC 700027 / DSM 9790 / JCM 10055 / NBRC 100828 / KAW 2/3) TaxID=1122961 RepID=A0A8G2FXE7_PICTO|nr:formate dehydrogenase subunit alpha [Picrophilus oshimae]SMD31252.1 formate dehydrogenase major subunit [Picrophilus oshimae DSM 9789]
MGTLTIEKNRYNFLEGDTLLNVFIKAGIDIPHVCYNPALGPLQSCDTCIVSVNGRLVRSCSTIAEDNMNIEYKNNDVKNAQIEAINRLLREHNLHCTVCENNNGDCALHNAVDSSGLERQKYKYEKKPYEIDDSNPFYRYDPNECILCGRCVEACQDVEVNETIHIDWTLERPRVVWDDGKMINESSCVSCGHCVTVCPVNALMEKSMLEEAGYFTSLTRKAKESLIDFGKNLEDQLTIRPIMEISNIEARMRNEQIKKTKTVCTYCGVGCSFTMWTKGRKILKVQPEIESPANGISTCIKGKFGWGFVNSDDRLKRPLIRKNNKFVEVSWDEALDFAAAGLKRISDKYGGDSIMFIASSKGTNEEAYLIQKMARQIFKTNNVDNSSRFCQAPATTGLWRTVGYGGDAGSIDDIYNSELVMIVGANTAESHPVIATRIKRAHKLNNQRLIVIDLRRNEMAQRADLFLHPRPGTDLFLLSAITKYIIDNNWHDKKFIEERVNNFDEYYKSLDNFTLENAEKITGIDKNEIIKVASMIHSVKSMCILWAMGVTQHSAGSDVSTAISNLLLITGNYGRPGTGAYPLRGHNNVQGASDFGAMPTYLPGYQPINDKNAIKKFEKAWNTKLPMNPGIDNVSCIENIDNDKIKAMYIIGQELAETGPDTNMINKSLEKLEFLIVQDVFFSETARYANVVLPSCVSLEKEGTYVNTERRIQRIYKVMEPYAETRPDWEIIQDIARRLGYNWNYKSPSDIMDEAASLCPIFSGVSYSRLEGFNSMQWPTYENGDSSKYLYKDGFNFPDGRARLYILKYRPPIMEDDDYPLHLNNGRMLEHFHEGNETFKTPGIRDKAPDTFLEISPELADEYNIKTGDFVRVTSRYGSIKVRALVTDRVKGKELYMPMNAASSDNGINLLTSYNRDPDSDTPAYKELPVRIKKLKDNGGSPLPKTNPRFGTPVPQIGINIEMKWKRADYKKITGD